MINYLKLKKIKSIIGVIFFLGNIGIALAASNTWDLNNPANYVISNPAEMEINSGIARLKSNLDMYWKLDEVSWTGAATEVKDSSYQHNDGVAVNGLNTIASGKIGRDGNFITASKHYLDFGSTIANPGTNNFSYGLWFKTTATTNNSLLARSVYSASDGRYGLLINNGTITSLLDLGPQYNNVYAAGANDGNWHFVVATIDRGGNSILYLDGVQVVQRDITASSAFDFTGFARNLYIGAYNDNTGLNPHASALYFNGEIDEVFFTERILTDSEIATIYNGDLGQRSLFSFHKPYITANNSQTFISGINSFTENLGANNEGTINYQISSDNGITWKYWNGIAWVTTVATDGSETNLVIDINNHIATFDTDGGDFKWRAFLESDGGEKVELDSISIDYPTNHNPTDIILSSNTISENQASGTNIGVLSTTDLDGIDTHTYTLVVGSGDEDNSKFQIGSGIDSDKVQLNFVPDYENPTDLAGVAGDNEYAIRIQTDDGHGGIYQKSFNINIIDVKESSGKSGKRKNKLSGEFVCKDTRALNFSSIGQHDESLCIYNKNEEEKGLESIENEKDEMEEKKKSEELEEIKKCSEAVFTKFYQRGDQGEEIKRIQKFLQNEGFLSKYQKITGYYGIITEYAVRLFQEKYSKEILKPWGLVQSTGKWYQTTSSKANEIIGCQNK